MPGSIFSIGLSFLEGLALIASPCILPILPIILAGSFSGSRKRPFGIIIGFIAFFTLFTFFSRKFFQYSGIDLNLIRHISYGILILLAIIMLSTYLTEKFNRLTQRLLNTGSNLKIANNSEGGLFSGLLFGGLVAIIWTPCAGPILAAVIVQTVIQQTNYISFLTLLAFSLGVAVPMFLIVIFGRSLMNKLSFFKTHATLFRKALGVIILLSVAYVISLEFSVAPVSASVAIQKQAVATTSNTLVNGLTNPYPAPPIEGIETWINSPPLQISQLKGKVVLIDFWAYSCINCIRTLPYLKSWYAKYHDKGLVIIGVHSPEFDFEKEASNVKNAVKQRGILYPVALDNQFVTWRNFNNSYWPAHYLINKNGVLVYTHFGEGDYDVTENNIRFLLGLGEDTSIKSKEAATFSEITPETYFGYDRAEHFSSPETLVPEKINTYSFPKKFKINDWALEGKWVIMPDKIVSAGNKASISIHFQARHVYVVAGTSGKPISVNITLNGKPLTAYHGKDVLKSSLRVEKHTLYELIDLPSVKDGNLTITAPTSGLELYTFTFGD